MDWGGGGGLVDRLGVNDTGRGVGRPFVLIKHAQWAGSVTVNTAPVYPGCSAPMLGSLLTRWHAAHTVPTVASAAATSGTSSIISPWAPGQDPGQVGSGGGGVTVIGLRYTLEIAQTRDMAGQSLVTYGLVGVA